MSQVFKNGFFATFLICALSFGCAQEDEHTKRQWKDKDRQVRENMRLVQVGAERYAGDHGGIAYPTAVDDEFKSYFPGGIEGKRPAPVGSVNPYSGENEFPTIGNIDSLEKARSERVSIEPGKILYSTLEKGKSYAIVGGAHDGKALMDPNSPEQVLVYSNQ